MGGFVSADGRAASRGRDCSARGAKERLRAAPSPARGFLRLLSLVCFFSSPFHRESARSVRACSPSRGAEAVGRSGAERSAAHSCTRGAPCAAPRAQSCAAAARLVPEPPLCSEPFVRRVRGPSEPFRAPPRCGGIPARPGAARGLQAVCLGKGVGCAGCSGLGGLPGWLSAPCGGDGDVGSSKGGPVVLWVNCGFSKRSGMPWSLGACSQLGCWFHRAV